MAIPAGTGTGKEQKKKKRNIRIQDQREHKTTKRVHKLIKWVFQKEENSKEWRLSGNKEEVLKQERGKRENKRLEDGA